MPRGGVDRPEQEHHDAASSTHAKTSPWSRRHATTRSIHMRPCSALRQRRPAPVLRNLSQYPNSSHRSLKRKKRVVEPSAVDTTRDTRAAKRTSSHSSSLQLRAVPAHQWRHPALKETTEEQQLSTSPRMKRPRAGQMRQRQLKPSSMLPGASRHTLLASACNHFCRNPSQAARLRVRTSSSGRRFQCRAMVCGGFVAPHVEPLKLAVQCVREVQKRRRSAGAPTVQAHAPTDT